MAQKFAKYNFIVFFIAKHKLKKNRESMNIKEAVVITKDNIQTIKTTPEKRTLDDMNIHRYCCRRHFLTTVEIIDYL